MAKRSTNFGGAKRWRRGNEAESLLATMKALGMTDEQIREALEKMKKDKKDQPK